MNEFLVQIADGVGIGGVVMLVLAYYLLQSNRIASDSILYSLMNLVGAGLILYSLVLDWNTPAVIMESVWIVISMFALVKAFIKKDA